MVKLILAILVAVGLFVAHTQAQRQLQPADGYSIPPVQLQGSNYQLQNANYNVQ